MERRWLQYSEDLDAVFCVVCKLFDSSAKKISLKDGGCQDWKHISELHETSHHHRKSCLSWCDTKQNLKSAAGVDSQIQSQIHEETTRWREILRRIIEVVKFLASRNLAFQGSSEKLRTPGNGNFLGSLELVAKFDPVLQGHLDYASGPQRNAHYLSHQSQYFSIILDCTLIFHTKNKCQ